MKNYSVLVKIGCVVSEMLIKTIFPCCLKISGGAFIALTKEYDDVFCVEFSLNTETCMFKEIERDILALLGHIVVGI